MRKDKKNLKLRTSTFGLKNKLGIIAIVCLLIFAGYSGVNATIKLGEDGSGQKWFGDSAGLITNSNGKAWAATGDNIQIAMDDGPGVVTVPSGTFTPSLLLTIPSGVWLKGQGNSTVIKNIIRFDGDTHNQRLSDISVHGYKVQIYNGYDRLLENVVVNDSYTFGFQVYSNADVINNTRFVGCQAINCDNCGFAVSGEGTTPNIENTTFERCVASTCGPGDVAGEDWACGFMLFGEHHNLTVRNMLLTNCIAYDNYESGFHTETTHNIENLVLTNCISENNGLRKSGASYASGYLMGDATFIGCKSRGDNITGFRLDGECILVGCEVDGNNLATGHGIYAPSELYNTTISGCTVHGCQIALRLLYVYNSTITGNVFSNCSNPGGCCINFMSAGAFAYSTNVIISNNIFRNLTGTDVMRVRGYNFNINTNNFYDVVGSTHGIYLERSHCKFNNNILEDCSDVYLKADHLQVNGNTFVNSIADAIGTESTSDHHQINNNKFYFCGDEAIDIYNGNDIQINNNQIYNTSGIGIYLEEGCNDISLVGNHIEDTAGHGIFTHYNGNRNIINSNEIYNGGAHGIALWCSNATVIGNIVYNNVGDGLSINGWNNTITSNRIYGNGDNGIEEDAGNCGNNIIVANNCLGNTGSAIIITGTGTVNSSKSWNYSLGGITLFLNLKNHHLTPRILTFSSYMLGFALSTVLMITFLWAYFLNNMVFAININTLGEAHIELVLLVTIFCIMLHGAYFQIKSLGVKCENN